MNAPSPRRARCLLASFLLTASTLSAAPAPQSWAVPSGDAERPTRIAWQRSLADAESISRKSGKPLLICVNLDQEAASEVFAWSKYRDPEFTRLVEGFVPLILSANRHAPRDHDERGRRVVCPRFGVVTCGEHIREEPLAFERYFDGSRVAPRHIGVAPGGDVLFDLFLLQDLSIVDDELRQHGRGEPPAWATLLASRDARDRSLLEALYIGSDTSTRTAILDAAGAQEGDQAEILRLGLNEDDPSLRLAAARAVASHGESTAALDLALEALASEQDESVVAALVGGLEARSEARAMRAVRARRGLAEADSALDAETISTLLASSRSRTAGGDDADFAERIDEFSEVVIAHPEDPTPRVALAMAFLDFANHRIATGRDPRFLLEDARREAEEAASRGASPAQTGMVRAWSAYLLGESAAALELSTSAAQALAKGDEEVVARVLEVLARTATSAIYAAESAGDDWPGDLLGRAHAAHRLLGASPASTSALFSSHVDLLDYLGLVRQRGEALDNALTAFGGDPDLHRRFRAHVEATAGPEGLITAYIERRPRASDVGTHDWFAGYAALIAAESQRRLADNSAATDAYQTSIALFDRSGANNADFADSAAHYAALAEAGLAALALERGELAIAVDILASSIARRPQSALWPDGLGTTPRETLRRARRAAQRADDTALLARLDELEARVEAEREGSAGSN